MTTSWGLTVPLTSCSATDATPSPPLARRVLVTAAFARDCVLPAPRLAAVAVPLAPERAVRAVLDADAPARFAAAPEPPLRAPPFVVAVALVPLEAAAFVAREPFARLLAGLEDFELLVVARFAGGMHRLLIDFFSQFASVTEVRDHRGRSAQPISSSRSAFCAWRRFSA
jgi:hypothetical protein